MGAIVEKVRGGGGGGMCARWGRWGAGRDGRALGPEGCCDGVRVG